MSAVKVVLDVHEPVKVHQALEGHPDVEEVKLAPLEAADIAIGGIGFERKTWSDYVGSMMGDEEGYKRLPEQDEKLGEYDAAYILVEGDMAGTEQLTYTDMKPESIRGHMASLTARSEYNVRGVIPCSNTALLADYAVRLARKHTEDPTSEYLPTGSVASTEPAGKQMWGCLPNVGPKLAERLWWEFGSPVQFSWEFIAPFRTLPDEAFAEKVVPKMTMVEGLGESTAKDILEILTEESP